jgi:hypothetical protein
MTGSKRSRRWARLLKARAVCNDALGRRGAARQNFGRALPPASAKNNLPARRADGGLHYEDVQKLIDILNRLVAAGNTVVLIEHNMDIIKNADWLLDFGPEGGEGGGKLGCQRHARRCGQSQNLTSLYLVALVPPFAAKPMTI